MTVTERLYRSGRNKILGGVCGGLAEYFNIDPTLIRLIAIVTIFAIGAGFVAYIACWIIIPMNPNDRPYLGRNSREGGFSDDIRANVQDVRTDIEDAARNFSHQVNPGQGTRWAGIVLIVLGLLFFLDRWFPFWFNFNKMWPLVLVILGAAVIIRGERH
ncbi:DNA-binding transcriptional activator PspC [Peptococcaceae bacterium CEB3]|nr:DNA-binding transcriptional activator PspC [Peptococcaceae bacterium CEB3]